MNGTLNNLKTKPKNKGNDQSLFLWIVLLSLIIIVSAVIINFDLGYDRFQRALDIYKAKNQPPDTTDTNAAALFGGTK